ncbi:hypothetical protein GCM10027589_20280 [Actinocorallia lasiicapitis]
MVVDTDLNGGNGLGRVEVTGPSGEALVLRPGDVVVFGRDPAAELPVTDDPWLSRRAGEISVLAEGVRVSNLSQKHALFIRFPDDTVRLPALGERPRDKSCLVSAGTVRIGTAAMLDQDRPVLLTLTDQITGPAPVRDGGDRQSTTERPLELNPLTKEFMVAFVLCRPWLDDPSRMAPLPSAPEIAEAALRITQAHHLLRALPDPAVRTQLSQRVHECIKGLRAKLRAKRLLRADPANGWGLLASTLLYYDVIGPRHLALLKDAGWLSAQEDKWWGDQ